MSNNWDSEFELAFMIYLDIINLLPERLEAMGN
jgi:FtsH-binding integral membrane protein